jgi:hypothetical protein
VNTVMFAEDALPDNTDRIGFRALSGTVGRDGSRQAGAVEPEARAGRSVALFDLGANLRYDIRRQAAVLCRLSSALA